MTCTVPLDAFCLTSKPFYFKSVKNIIQNSWAFRETGNNAKREKNIVKTIEAVLAPTFFHATAPKAIV